MKETAMWKNLLSLDPLSESIFMYTDHVPITAIGPGDLAIGSAWFWSSMAWLGTGAMCESRILKQSADNHSRGRYRLKEKVGQSATGYRLILHQAWDLRLNSCDSVWKTKYVRLRRQLSLWDHWLAMSKRWSFFMTLSSWSQMELHSNH